MGPVVLQAGREVLAVGGTVASLALFLSVTAHVAARNVLGDVPLRNALAVGPLPAAIAVAGTALELPPALAIAAAVAVDAALIGYLYRPGRRLTLYVTFIHAVVSVLLGAVLVAGYLLLRSAPGG